MGFSDIPTIELGEADVYDTSDNYKLSWHVNYSGGGWRLGSLTDLNGNDNYDRVVLIAPASAPDSGATVAMLGCGLLGLAALRRRFARA